MGMSSGDIVGGSGEEDMGELGLGGERQDSRTPSSMQHTTSFPVTQALVSLLAANSSLIHVAGKGEALTCWMKQAAAVILTFLFIQS